jgi:predicted protein tyrosine phosphatase
VTGKEIFDMKTLNEIESVCSRILSVLEHEDLRSGTLVTLSTMMARVRSDLEAYLAEWRSIDGDSAELRSARESLRTLKASLLWQQEYAEIKPVVEVSHRLRMASLRALQVIALLQHIPQAATPDTAVLSDTWLVSSRTTSPTV